METLLTVIHVFVAIFLILTILIQSGKGGGLGALGGGGAGGQIFGGSGAGNFLAKLTTGAAIVFFLTSLTLSINSANDQSVVKTAAEKATDTTAVDSTATEETKAGEALVEEQEVTPTAESEVPAPDADIDADDTTTEETEPTE